MNKLSTDRRAALISALVEGNSIRSTARMTDTAFNTVLKFVADIGTVCRAFLDATMRDLSCRRLQADEIWQFCYAKDKNLPDAMRGKPGVGSVWTWVAIDADTKDDLDREPFRVVVGRDVLRCYVLTYNGPKGAVTLSYEPTSPTAP